MANSDHEVTLAEVSENVCTIRVNTWHDQAADLHFSPNVRGVPAQGQTLQSEANTTVSLALGTTVS